MGLLRLAAPWLLLLQLLLRSSLVACYPTPAPAVQAQQKQQQNQQQGIFGGDEAPHDAVDIQSVLAALGLLSGTFLIVLVGLRAYLHCIRRRPARREQRKKMTEADIEKRFPIKKSEGGETCVVCLSNVEAGDDCRVTQCGHTFHADCLLSWWLYKPRRVLRCPICRTRQRSKPKKAAADDLEASAGCDAEGKPAPGADGGGEDVQPLELPVPLAGSDEKRELGKRDSDDSSLDEHPKDANIADTVVDIVASPTPRAAGVRLDAAQGDLELEDAEMDSNVAGDVSVEV